MSDAPSLGIALAFGAGLLSFISPCVLPLIPSYLTFVTGVGLDALARSRRAAFVHALLFVLGFTLIFVALGASAKEHVGGLLDRSDTAAQLVAALTGA